MVARDPMRKVTLDAHTKFDGSKKGADRYASPQVGSTVNIPDPELPKHGGEAKGTGSHEASSSKKKG